MGMVKYILIKRFTLLCTPVYASLIQYHLKDGTRNDLILKKETGQDIRSVIFSRLHALK